MLPRSMERSNGHPVSPKSGSTESNREARGEPIRTENKADVTGPRTRPSTALGSYGVGVGEGGGAGIFSFGKRGSISSRMAR